MTGSRPASGPSRNDGGKFASGASCTERCEHGRSRTEGCKPCFWVGGQCRCQPATAAHQLAEPRHTDYAILCSTGKVHALMSEDTLPHSRDLADQVCLDRPHVMAHRLVTGWMEWTP